jgi:hypothetical protein
MKEIELTNGMKAIVDDEDYDYLLDYNWRCVKNGRTYYALFSRRIKGKFLNFWMHRMIMDAKERKDEVNHINHNGLDNRKENLRITTHNKVVVHSRVSNNKPTKHKGISYHKPTNKWRARIHINGKTIYLGYYIDETEAAKAYEKKAIELFGEYAHITT